MTDIETLTEMFERAGFKVVSSRPYVRGDKTFLRLLGSEIVVISPVNDVSFEFDLAGALRSVTGEDY